MSSFSSICTCVLIPWTSILPQPFQHIQMSSSGSICTCVLIPRTTILMCPFQHIQMSSFGRNHTYICVVERNTRTEVDGPLKNRKSTNKSKTLEQFHTM